MLCSQGFLSNGQGPLVQGLGLGVFTLIVVEQGQVVQTRRHIRVLGPQGFLQDGQGALDQWLGLGILALGAW